MSSALFFEEKNRVLRVAELNLAIKQLLESNVPLLWVRGEISNLVKAASGHFYSVSYTHLTLPTNREV